MIAADILTFGDSIRQGLETLMPRLTLMKTMRLRVRGGGKDPEAPGRHRHKVARDYDNPTLIKTTHRA
ncbi:hypothetical protein J7T55_010068 [Diaporthe amygdali]|uniref:uncharacterized protein n=1 Tax=Phomopsis amygdali TaxID=1214568 RepID=UPI0022FE91C8|nr:uncharacterized protein J7T55_010068 [Diaporthe amygdali]KAJ0113824.1 hypothetical protein J7T55_010068 [Diaporthe amygdali]